MFCRIKPKNNRCKGHPTLASVFLCCFFIFICRCRGSSPAAGSRGYAAPWWGAHKSNGKEIDSLLTDAGVEEEVGDGDTFVDVVEV